MKAQGTTIRARRRNHIDGASDAYAGIDELNALSMELRSSEPARALEVANHACERAEAAGYSAGLAQGLRSAGIIHDRLADHEAALAALERALALFRELGNHEAVAELHNDLGVVYFHIGAYERSLEYELESLRLHSGGENRVGESQALNNIGNVYYARGKYHDALVYYQQSLDIDAERGDRGGVGIGHINVGLIHYKLGDHAPALERFERALEITREVGDTQSEAFALSNIGTVLRKVGRLEEARGYVRRALALRRKLGLRRDVAHSLYSLGLLARDMKDPVAACRHYRAALVLAEELGARRELYEIHRELARVYADRTMYREALRHHQAYHDLEKGVFNDESDAAMRRLMVQHNVERMRQQSELYRLKSEHLELVLASRTQELAAAALNVVQRNEFLNVLAHQLEGIAARQKNRSVRALLEGALKRMNAELNVEEQWKLFSSQLTTAHSGFLARLGRRYPSLRPTELKICSLLRLRLGTKEVASLLNVGVRDIEKHRMNIRRKLAVAPGVDLVETLAAFDADAAQESPADEGAFLTALARRFPELTLAERKICSLLRLNLATKEMAQILSLSARSVENHRYRIRRKLGIGIETSLAAFLMGIREESRNVVENE